MGKKTTDAEQLDELRDLVTDGDGDGIAKKSTNRRGMLKMAGAALLGAAAAGAVKAVPAAAATGDNMVIGAVQNDDTGTATVLQSSVGGVGTFIGQNQANTGIGLGGDGTTGVRGQGAAQGGASTAAEIGVVGTSKSGSGTGVQGNAGGGVGVHGNATSGAAGFFVSTTGYDTQLGALNGDSGIIGSGRLSTIGRPDVGGVSPNWNPAFFVHTSLGIRNFQHEFVRGADGSIWASRAVSVASGIPPHGRWKRVNAIRTDAADGTGAPYKALRLADTRSGLAGSATNLKGPFSGAYNVTTGAGITKTIAVAGVGSGASAIPFDAVAAWGNLTIIAGASGGFLAIHAHGAAYSAKTDPATLSFGPGQVISNAWFVGLGGGAVDVFIGIYGGGSVNFIVDINGYGQ